jgi:serine/threonine protein kinase
MAAKTYLQSLGIMYIDWKPDNMGVDKHGTYKLFDFNASGIATLPDCKEWIKKYRPFEHWSYRQALAKGLKDPKEIDDYAFEIGFYGKNSENVELGPRLSSSGD